MYEIVMLNEKGERFVVGFSSYYLYEKSLNKYKHSKKIKVLSYGKVD